MTQATDTELLDRLAAQAAGDMWVARASLVGGPGYHLYSLPVTTASLSRPKAHPTPREALQAMVDAEDAR